MNPARIITDWKMFFIEKASGNERLKKIEKNIEKKQKELKEHNKNNGKNLKKLEVLTEQLIEKEKQIKKEKEKYEKLFIKIANLAEQIFEQRIEELDTNLFSEIMECNAPNSKKCKELMVKYRGFSEKVLKIVKMEIPKCQTTMDGTNTQSTS